MSDMTVETFYDAVLFTARSRAYFSRNAARRIADEIDRLRDRVLQDDDKQHKQALAELRELKPARDIRPEEGMAEFLIMVDMSLPLWGLKPDDGPSDLSRVAWDVRDGGAAFQLAEAALDELLDNTGRGDLTEFRKFDAETPMPRRPDRPHLRVVPDADHSED